LLLSFIPLFCIVASNREIANLNISSSSLAMAKPLESNAILENVQISGSKGRTIISSTNILRELSVLSKVSSIEYLTCIKAQSNDPNWAN